MQIQEDDFFVSSCVFKIEKNEENTRKFIETSRIEKNFYRMFLKKNGLKVLWGV